MRVELRRQAVIAGLVLVIIATNSLLAATALGQSATPGATPPSDQLAFVLEPAEPGEVGYVSVVAEPGITQETDVTFGVAQGEVEAVLVYKADALPLTNGGFAAAEAGTEPTGATAWIEFETARHTFEPGDGMQQTLTILVPEGTAAGQYVSALVIQTAEPIPIPGQESFNQTIRLLLPVLITVPGPLNPDIAVGEPTLVPNSGRSRSSRQSRTPATRLSGPRERSRS